MSREIPLAEVKKHSSEKSCWMVIHSNIYDVTKFLAEHPGGETVLVEYAGKDASVAFEDVGHSDDAKDMLKKYKIGKLPDSEQPTSSSGSCCRSPYDRVIRRMRPQAAHIPCRVKDKQAARERRRLLKCKKPKKRSKKPPYESFPCPIEEEEGGSNLKWALIALAAALFVGVILKKSLGS